MEPTYVICLALVIAVLVIPILANFLESFIEYKRKRKSHEMPKQVFNDIMNEKCKCDSPCNEYCYSKSKFRARL